MKRIGAQIVERMREFTDVLQRGEPISERFTVRRIKLDRKPTPYDPQKVKATRKLLNASQAVFAWFLGVKIQTVRAWEQGVNPPSDLACRFMDLIQSKPEWMRSRLREMAAPPPAASAARHTRKRPAKSKG